MIDVVAEFPEKPECWSRLFGGELHEILLPHASKDWVWTNPSILRGENPDEYLCAIRLMSSPWRYNSTSVITIANLDSRGIVKAVKQISAPENDRPLMEDVPIIHHGPHDCRIFRAGGQLFGTATFWDNSKDCVQEDGTTLARIGLIRIEDDLTWTHTVILPSLFGGVEKNWMPIEDSLEWLYFPPRNVFATYSIENSKVSFKNLGRTAEAMEYARGSTQLIRVPGDKLLGIVHEVAEPAYSYRNFAYRLRYAHKFVLYDAKTRNLLGVSPLFYFISPNCIEFAAGLTLDENTDKLIVSFGYRDISAWLAEAALSSVLGSMRMFAANFD